MSSGPEMQQLMEELRPITESLISQAKHVLSDPQRERLREPSKHFLQG